MDRRRTEGKAAGRENGQIRHVPHNDAQKTHDHGQDAAQRDLYPMGLQELARSFPTNAIVEARALRAPTRTIG